MGGYYGISSLIFYRKEIAAWIRSRSHSQIMPVVLESKKETESNVIGSVSNATEKFQNVSTIASDELTVSEETEEPDLIPPHNHTDPLMSLMYDLLSQAKTLIRLLVKYNSTPNECEELLRSLLLRYPQLKNSEHQSGVSIYIVHAAANQLSISFSIEQVTGWWNDTIK